MRKLFLFVPTCSWETSSLLMIAWFESNHSWNVSLFQFNYLVPWFSLEHEPILSVKILFYFYTCIKWHWTLNLLNFLNGIIHLLFLELSITFLEIQRWELKVGQPTAWSLVSLHRWADWPISILLVNVNRFRFQQSKG